MKVKVGDKTYDSEEEPVMVILTDQDKKNIANMLPEATKYCMYPATEHWVREDFKNILKWIKDTGK